METYTDNLDFVVQKIHSAKSPFDIFGKMESDTSTSLRKLQLLYRPLVKVVFPEAHVRNPTNYKKASDAFAKLSEFYSLAQTQIKNGNYDIALEPIILTVLGKTYKLEKIWKSGDICDLYVSGDEILKIAKTTGDDDLLLNEERNLKKIREFLNARPNGKIWLQTIPEIKHTFRLKDKDPLRANVLDYQKGFINGTTIVDRIKQIDARTLGWVWKRTINLLDWIKHSGYSHTAVLPQHLLFFPDNASDNKKDERKHATHLVDFSYSVPIGEKPKAWCPEYVAFYPPEVTKAKTTTKTTDLYMAAKTMIYLCGGDVTGNKFPSHIPKAMGDHILKCTNPDTENRMTSFGDHFKEYVSILEKEFGKPTWHDFIVPIIDED